MKPEKIPDPVPRTVKLSQLPSEGFEFEKFPVGKPDPSKAADYRDLQEEAGWERPSKDMT